jgi:membrane dipeptidase
VADHIDHIAKLVGIDHVGLGSDFDGITYVPEGLEDVSAYPNLIYELLKRGCHEQDIRKICGANFLAAWAAVEKAAGAPRPQGWGRTSQAVAADGQKIPCAGQNFP